MRTKEVEKAIKVIQRDITDYKEELEIEIEFEDGIDEQRVSYLTQQITSYETVLSYIETLEKQIPTPSNEVPVEYQTLILVDKRDAVMKSEIRDKIKELEELQKRYEQELLQYGDYNMDKPCYSDLILEIKHKIQVLKSIKGE